MLDYKVCAHDICEKHVNPIIDGYAPNSGLLHKDIVLFYAGPSKSVQDAVHGRRMDIKISWQRASKVAHRLKACRIDDTDAFKYLNSAEYKDILDKYQKVYAFNDYKKIRINKEVWNYVSARFAATDFKEAMTLVCGAGENSSFRLREMSSMLGGKHLEKVNNLPAQMFRDIEKLGKRELFRFCCLTFLLVLKENAETTGTNSAKQEFQRQLKYFKADYNNMLEDFLNLPTEKQREIDRKEAAILKHYGAYDKFESVLKKGMELEVILPVLKSPIHGRTGGCDRD